MMDRDQQTRARHAALVGAEGLIYDESLGSPMPRYARIIGATDLPGYVSALVSYTGSDITTFGRPPVTIVVSTLLLGPHDPIPAGCGSYMRPFPDPATRLMAPLAEGERRFLLADQFARAQAAALDAAYRDAPPSPPPPPPPASEGDKGKGKRGTKPTAATPAPAPPPPPGVGVIERVSPERAGVVGEDAIESDRAMGSILPLIPRGRISLGATAGERLVADVFLEAGDAMPAIALALELQREDGDVETVASIHGQNGELVMAPIVTGMVLEKPADVFEACKCLRACVDALVQLPVSRRKDPVARWQAITAVARTFSDTDD